MSGKLWECTVGVGLYSVDHDATLCLGSSTDFEDAIESLKDHKIDQLCLIPYLGGRRSKAASHHSLSWKFCGLSRGINPYRGLVRVKVLSFT